MNWRYRLSEIDLDQEDIDTVANVVSSRWLSCGPVTSDFESELASFLGARHAIAVSSCTTALHLALRCADIGPGDEVILPALTFVATVNCVLYTGATPVFADIGSCDDLTISVGDIQRRITDRTRAIIVMHYGGYPCNMDAILHLARKHDLAVIEDAAHAIGSAYDGHMLGTMGDMGCFSFYANKNIACGEGGALVTQNAAFAERARALRSHAMTTCTWDRERGHAFSYDVTDLGYNYRITELQAALACTQLRKLPGNNGRRHDLVMRYRKRLQRTPGITIPFGEADGRLAYHLFPILLDEDLNREDFMAAMRSMGIQSSIHYPPVHLFSYFKQRFKTGVGMLPTTEAVARRLVTLPLHPLLVPEDIDAISSAARSVLLSMGARHVVMPYSPEQAVSA